MQSCAWYLTEAYWFHLISTTTVEMQQTTLENNPRAKPNAPIIVVILKPTLNAILCMVTHIARVWINLVRESILHVVS